MPCKRRGAAGDVYLCPGSTPGAHLAHVVARCELQPPAACVCCGQTRARMPWDQAKQSPFSTSWYQGTLRVAAGRWWSTHGAPPSTTHPAPAGSGEGNGRRLAQLLLDPGGFVPRLFTWTNQHRSLTVVP